MSDTPIWDELVRELYAERTREAYAASPDMIGCGQWELPPEGDIPGMRRPRRERGLCEDLTIRDRSRSKAQSRIIGGMP